MKKLSFFLILAGLSLCQSCWRPKVQSQSEIMTSSPLDSINLYYGNLTEARFVPMGPREFLYVGRYRKISIPISSATCVDSVFSASLVALIESSRLSDTIKVISQEYWMPDSIQMDHYRVAIKRGLDPVAGVDTYYVIESIYSSGKRDSIALGRFTSNGIYHLTQGYISNENGLHECMLYYLIKRDPEWARQNGVSLDHYNTQ